MSVIRRDREIVIDVVGADEQVATGFVREYLLDPVDFEGKTLELSFSGTEGASTSTASAHQV